MTPEKAVEKVMNELVVATNRFGPFAGPHEGYAVILEELDELWDAIKEKRSKDYEEEAVQVAAMGLRFLVDCIKEEK